MAANAEYNGLARDRKHGVEQRHDGFLFCISYFGIFFLQQIMLNILVLNRKGGVEQGQDYQEYHLLHISKVVKVTS